MKILLLHQDIPSPVNSGARIRTWNFIKALSSDNELSILCFDKNGDASSPEMKKYFSNIWTVDPRKGDHDARCGRIKRLGYLSRGVPWQIYETFSEEFQARLREVIAGNRFDIILARYLVMGQYLVNNIRSIKANAVLDLDDIDFIKYNRDIGISSFNSRYDRFRRLFNNWLLKRYHKRLNSLSGVIVSSAKDRDYLKAEKLVRDPLAIPNSVDVSSYSSVAPFGKELLERKALLFCGNLSYGPNIDAANWFMDMVFPLIKRREPDARLHVVGLKPPRDLCSRHDGKNIFVFPDVPEVMPYYNLCSAVIVPIRTGGGTRIKILEAFSCRRPVISTAIGAEGLEVINNKHCLIRDGAEGFASGCLTLLSDYRLSETLVQEAYRLARATYDSPQIAKRIQELFFNA